MLSSFITTSDTTDRHRWALLTFQTPPQPRRQVAVTVYVMPSASIELSFSSHALSLLKDSHPLPLIHLSTSWQLAVSCWSSFNPWKSFYRSSKTMAPLGGRMLFSITHLQIVHQPMRVPSFVKLTVDTSGCGQRRLNTFRRWYSDSLKGTSGVYQLLKEVHPF